jgi:CAAX prenyl protease-like protein
LICAVLFGLEHNLILAGIMAGVAYSLLLYWTKSIYQCILAHAVTNLVLGIYVLQTGYWQFW